MKNCVSKVHTLFFFFADTVQITINVQGAGDQGMMFGYACNETDNYMPLSLELAHLLLKELAQIRKEGQLMQYLRPDSKSQVTIEYGDEGKPVRIHTIVISTQHDDFIKPANETPEAQLKADEAMVEWIRKDIDNNLTPCQPCISMRTSDYKFTGRVDKKNDIFIE